MLHVEREVILLFRTMSSYWRLANSYMAQSVHVS
jgi:hypothetical protein